MKEDYFYLQKNHIFLTFSRYRDTYWYLRFQIVILLFTPRQHFGCVSSPYKTRAESRVTVNGPIYCKFPMFFGSWTLSSIFGVRQWAEQIAQRENTGENVSELRMACLHSSATHLCVLACRYRCTLSDAANRSRHT